MFEVWLKSLIDSVFIIALFFAVEFAFRSAKPVKATPFWWPRVIFLWLLRISTGLFTGVLIGRLVGALNLPGEGYAAEFWKGAPAVVSFFFAFLVYTFLLYWTHRLRHRVSFFWRLCHQMHHSPQRFDFSLSVYTHPFDTVNAVIVLFTTAIVCGLNLQVISLLAVVHNLLDHSHHLHIHTPRWLGYVLFRPEQHSLHHSTHDINYGIIPLWDMIFGTFKNCDGEAEHIGFPGVAQNRFWSIFFFKKVW